MSATLFWAIAAVVLVAGGVVLLWIRWKAAAFPGKAEIQAFMASGETSTVINGWELSKSGPPYPEDDEILTDGGPHHGQSFFEAFILRPVSPMAKVRRLAWFATEWWKSRASRRAMAPTIQALRSAVEEVMNLLAGGDYEQLIARCSKSRLSAADLSEAVRQYGRTIVVPPPAAYDLLDAVQVETTTVPTWSVWMPLWTREEGRSDLTIHLTIALPEGKARIELDDLLVP